MEFLRQLIIDWLAPAPADVEQSRRNYLSVFGDGRAYVGRQKERLEISYQGQQMSIDTDHARLLVEDLADELGMGSFLVPAPPLRTERWRGEEIGAIADGLGIENRVVAVTLAMQIYEMKEGE